MAKMLVEDPKSCVDEAPFVFPPHRRRPLQSETYRTLLRIVSHCYNQPRHQPRQLTQDDNGGNEPRHDSEKSGEEKGVGVEAGENSKTREKIDAIENLLNLEEDEDVGKEMELMGGDGEDGSGRKEKDVGWMQQLLVEELENVMKGNEESGRNGNCEVGSKILEANEIASGGVVEVFNNQREGCDGQRMDMEKSREVIHGQVDEQLCGKNASESLNASLDKGIPSEVSKLNNDSANEGFSLTVYEVGVNLDMLHKEIELEKSVCIAGTIGSPNCIVEEGEICGGLEMNELLADMVSENAEVPEENKVDENNAAEAVADKNKLPVNGKNDVNIRVNAVDVPSNVKAVVASEIARSEVLSKRKVVTYEDPFLTEGPIYHKKQKMDHGAKEQRQGSGAEQKKKAIVANNSVVCSAGSQRTASEEKDPGPCNKKKRGGKAQKKQKERKKRAEKNRELGVKRLKLRSVVQTKPVSYCRHYLNGRCHEGENCRFSHDIVPLTKSKPCVHFARHSCMKGDDCPFDHQLSKYPCTNFKNGSCSRGAACMFSHKVPLKEDSSSTSNVSTPDPKPPSSQGTSNSKKQFTRTPHQTAKPLPHLTGIMPCKITEPKMPASEQTPPVQVPKGIRFLSGGKSPALVGSSHFKPDSSSSKTDGSGNIENPIHQTAAGTVQTPDETAKYSSPAVPPKGINFLSFGRSPLEYSSTRKLTSLSLNGGDGAKLSLSSNLNIKQASSSPNTNDHAHVGKDTTQTVSDKTPGSKEVVQKNQLTVAALKANPFSFGDSSAGSARGNTQASLPSSLSRGIDRSAEASKSLSNGLQNYSAIQRVRSTFPLGSGQSLGSPACGWLKGTPSSAQKALESTLAFAAKIEPEIKMNRPTIGSMALGISGIVGKAKQ